MNDTDHDGDDSALERALADVEMLEAAFPDEVTVVPNDAENGFPIRFILTLDSGSSATPTPPTLSSSQASTLELQLTDGYPERSGVQIVAYRSNQHNKAGIDAVAHRVREVAQECLDEQMEGALACCTAALEEWNEQQERLVLENERQSVLSSSSSSPATTVSSVGTGRSQSGTALSMPPPLKHFDWVSGEPLLDRKSTFQAHVCVVHTEQDVLDALSVLIDNSSKLQRASHNMYAWRILDPETGVLKHDNDDDGEDGAGSRMAQLLHFREETNVLVVVSRWFGGIHLGPKRFAHISNVSRELLVRWHEEKNGGAKAVTSKRRGR